MSQRHVLTTGFMYTDVEDREDIVELISALRQHWSEVIPQYSLYGRLRWITIFTRDGDGVSTAIELKEFIPTIGGILKNDFEIVAAWDCAPEGTQVVWPVKGRGQEMTRLEWIDRNN